MQTRFREIYLVTKQRDNCVSVPLRANLFVAEILKFQTLFREHHGEAIARFTLGDFLVELARHLVSKFDRIEYEAAEKANPRLVFGSVAAGYGDNQRLEIIDISVDATAGREVVEFDDEGDTTLHEFIGAEIDSVFACAPILFAVKGLQGE